MDSLQELNAKLPDKWKFTEETKNSDVLELLYKTYFILQKEYEINEKTDLGFGYTLEETVKHIQDDDAEGKQLADAYRAMIGERLRRKNGLIKL